MLGTVIAWALLAGRGVSQNMTENTESSISTLFIDRTGPTTTFATITQLPPTRTTIGPRTTYGSEFVTLTSTTTSDDTYTPSSTETGGEDEDPTSEPTADPTAEPTQDWDTEPPPSSSTEEWVPPPSTTHSPNPDDNYVPTTFVGKSAPRSTSTSATSTLPSQTAATSLTAARTSGDESVFLSTRTLIPVGTDSPTAAAVGVAGHSKANVGAIAGGTVGGVVALALIALAIWFFLKRRSQEKARLAQQEMFYIDPDPRLMPQPQPPLSAISYGVTRTSSCSKDGPPSPFTMSSEHRWSRVSSPMGQAAVIVPQPGRSLGSSTPGPCSSAVMGPRRASSLSNLWDYDPIVYEQDAGRARHTHTPSSDSHHNIIPPTYNPRWREEEEFV